MIVMYPNEVSGLVDISNTSSKCEVGCLVCGIMKVCRSVLCGNILPEEVMEERPKS